MFIQYISNVHKAGEHQFMFSLFETKFHNRLKESLNKKKIFKNIFQKKMNFLKSIYLNFPHSLACDWR